MEDPQEIIDQTMAELEEYYATDEEDDGEEDGEEQSLEGGDGDQEELGEEPGEDDQQNENAGNEEGVVTLPNGSRLAMDEIQRLAEFEAFLNTHPDVAARVVEAARIPSSPPVDTPSATPSPQIPEFIDQEDPSTKWFVEQLTTLRTEHARLQAEDAQRRLEASNHAAEQALLSVKDRLELNDTEVNRLRDYTASLQIVPGIMTRHQGNLVAGFTEALEIAAYSLPEYRDKIIAKQVENKTKVVKADNTRKNKLNKLSNRSGGGAPPPRQGKAVKEMSEEERREAMILDIAQDMGVPR